MTKDIHELCVGVYLTALGQDSKCIILQEIFCIYILLQMENNMKTESLLRFYPSIPYNTEGLKSKFDIWFAISASQNPLKSCLIIYVRQSRFSAIVRGTDVGKIT